MDDDIQLDEEEKDPFTPLNPTFPMSIGLGPHRPGSNYSPLSSGESTPRTTGGAKTPSITLTLDSPEWGHKSTNALGMNRSQSGGLEYPFANLSLATPLPLASKPLTTFSSSSSSSSSRRPLRQSLSEAATQPHPPSVFTTTVPTTLTLNSLTPSAPTSISTSTSTSNTKPQTLAQAQDEITVREAKRQRAQAFPPTTSSMSRYKGPPAGLTVIVPRNNGNGRIGLGGGQEELRSPFEHKPVSGSVARASPGSPWRGGRGGGYRSVIWA